MYYQRNSYYQYEEPVAMFSMAEVEKYNKYQGTGMALFASFKDFSKDADQITAAARRPPAPKKLTGAGKQVRRVIRTGGDLVRGGTSLGSDMAGGAGIQAAKGLAGLGKGIQSASTGLGGGFLSKGVSSVGGGVRELGKVVAKNPRLAAAAMLAGGVGAAAGGTMFMRRRRTKTGKIVVEQVRR